MTDLELHRYRSTRPLRRELLLAGLAAAIIALGSSVEAKVIKWNCTLVANEKGLAPQKDFKMLFALDDVTGKATLIGNLGVADVIAVSGDRAITFLERLSSQRGRPSRVS